VSTPLPALTSSVGQSPAYTSASIGSKLKNEPVVSAAMSSVSTPLTVACHEEAIEIDRERVAARERAGEAHRLEDGAGGILERDHRIAARP
jgi:hypothetical protein